MLGQNALGMPPHAGGVPLSGVYYNRASSVVPGGEMGMRAGVGGASIGRFGWASADGTVLNARSSASDVQGLIVSQDGDWRRIYWDDVSLSWKICQGMNLTMLSGSPGMLVILEGSAAWGTPIYTDPVDGRVIPGYSLGLELTRWSVVNVAGAGGLSLITTWNNPP